jgi:hypothetical protein
VQISEYLLVRNCIAVKSLHQFFYYHSKYLNSVKCLEISMAPSKCINHCSLLSLCQNNLLCSKVIGRIFPKVISTLHHFFFLSFLFHVFAQYFAEISCCLFLFSFFEIFFLAFWFMQRPSFMFHSKLYSYSNLTLLKCTKNFFIFLIYFILFYFILRIAQR